MTFCLSVFCALLFTAILALPSRRINQSRIHGRPGAAADKHHLPAIYNIHKQLTSDHQHLFLATHTIHLPPPKKSGWLRARNKHNMVGLWPLNGGYVSGYNIRPLLFISTIHFVISLRITNLVHQHAKSNGNYSNYS